MSNVKTSELAKFMQKPTTKRQSLVSQLATQTSKSLSKRTGMMKLKDKRRLRKASNDLKLVNNSKWSRITTSYKKTRKKTSDLGDFISLTEILRIDD